MYNKRNHSICYTRITYEVHTLKNQNKNKRKSLSRDIFVYHFLFYICLIRNCKFAVIETRAYDIAHDENATTSLIIQSV